MKKKVNSGFKQTQEVITDMGNTRVKTQLENKLEKTHKRMKLPKQNRKQQKMGTPSTKTET